MLLALGAHNFCISRALLLPSTGVDALFVMKLQATYYILLFYSDFLSFYFIVLWTLSVSLSIIVVSSHRLLVSHFHILMVHVALVCSLFISLYKTPLSRPALFSHLDLLVIGITGALCMFLCIYQYDLVVGITVVPSLSLLSLQASAFSLSA
jgi:hypothetical protein